MAGRNDNLKPAIPGEVRNPFGRKGKVRRDASFRAVIMAADKLGGSLWTDKDYMPGATTHKAIVGWLEGKDLEDEGLEPDERFKVLDNRRKIFFKDILSKTIQPPTEESAEIDFSDAEAAIAAIMAQYIADPGFFRKVMEKAKDSEKLRPILMDLAAEICVFAIPAEAKEIQDDVCEQATDGEEVGEAYTKGSETTAESEEE